MGTYGLSYGDLCGSGVTDRLRVCTGSTSSTGSSSTAVASTGSRIGSQIATAVALDPGNVTSPLK